MNIENMTIFNICFCTPLREHKYPLPTPRESEAQHRDFVLFKTPCIPLMK